MIRKVIFLLLLPFLPIILYTACCGDIKFYTDIVSFTVHPIDKSAVLVDSIVTTDTLKLRIETLNQLIASQAAWQNVSLVSSAYATSCEDGDGGLKYPVQSINVYAKESYRKANVQKENLNDIVLYQPSSYWYDLQYTREKYLEYLNQKYGYGHPPVEAIILITQKSDLANEHIFIVEMIKSNGDTLTAETNKIIWN